MADLKRIIDDIKEMKVTEVAELIKMMEEEFGVSAAPVAVAGGPVAAAVVEEEKTEFNVKLKGMGANKVAVIKAVRELTGLGLVEAKNLVEALGVVKEGIPKAEAETFVAKLKDAGADAIIE